MPMRQFFYPYHSGSRLERLLLESKVLLLDEVTVRILKFGFLQSKASEKVVDMFVLHVLRSYQVSRNDTSSLYDGCSPWSNLFSII